MPKVQIERLTVGEIDENCYLVVDPETGELLVIDPGAEAERIFAAIGRRKPRAVLLTHGHFDHIGAVDAVCEKYGVPVYIHEADAPKLTDPEANTGCRFGHPVTVRTQPRLLHDDEELNLAGIGLKVLHTPGHTKGGCCFLTDEGQLFSGDTLFRRGWGRTDFPGGSEMEMAASLKRLRALSPETRVYPGHGAPTTIGEER